MRDGVVVNAAHDCARGARQGASLRLCSAIVPLQLGPVGLACPTASSGRGHGSLRSRPEVAGVVRSGFTPIAGRDGVRPSL